jgi:hypothetical protein
METQESSANGPRTDLDSLLAALEALLERIRDSARVPVQVHEQVEGEIRQAINHLFNAMEIIVDWMSQDHGLQPNAVLLLRHLRMVSDMLAGCIGGCPSAMVEAGAP